MGIVEHHRATAPQQVGETRLVGGLRELAIGRPAVALEDAGIVGAEHPRRLRKAAPVLNRVDRGGRGGECPQPMQVTTDFPPGFIGGDDGTATHHGAERIVGRLRLTRGAVDGVDQAATRNREAEPVVEQLRDPGEREPTLFVENDGERHGLRPELHGRRPEGIRRLERMATLDPAMARRALADGDAKLVHYGTLDG